MSKKRKITIQGELTDFNSYLSALNTNRYAGNAIKQENTHIVAQYARAAKIKPIKKDKYPIIIIYRWIMKNRRKDKDNIAFAKKFVNDGLVKAKVLPDDSWKYIGGFADRFCVDKKNPRVEVIIKTE